MDRHLKGDEFGWTLVKQKNNRIQLAAARLNTTDPWTSVEQVWCVCVLVCVCVCLCVCAWFLVFGFYSAVHIQSLRRHGTVSALKWLLLFADFPFERNRHFYELHCTTSSTSEIYCNIRVYYDINQQIFQWDAGI